MSVMDVEVVGIRKITGDGNRKAFADLKFGGSLIIKGFSVMQGKQGVFVSMPRQASKEGRWFETVTPDGILRNEVKNKVLEAYDHE